MTKPKSDVSPVVLTVGHSTRSLEDFIHLLQAHAVNKVIDVRTVPRSRHNPQFNQETLPSHLSTASIGYIHMPDLGGLRHPLPDSPNKGWRNSSFRGFADYMQTKGFETSLETIIQLARQDRISLMCAEALPWRCHRSLIADALLIRGIQVEHIMSPTHGQLHSLTSWAQVDGIRITYPPAKDIPKLNGCLSKEKGKKLSNRERGEVQRVKGKVKKPDNADAEERDC
ncbi:MAG: DNA repair protein [Deltaproteobacteria bacterium RBG_16_48_10]|nr:MAG: DNA repair protein [Deltaproteobacteria bacterium RBG_16_48_10]